MAHVYAAMLDGGPIKIGFTQIFLDYKLGYLRRRYGQIRLIGFERYSRGEDALIRERSLHRIFKSYRQGRCELFDITEDQLMEHFNPEVAP